MEERIAIESVRLSRRVKQSLDGKRQRAYGLRRYIWRSQDDKKVRASHAVNDDKIFEWDNPPPTGHPGDDYGCRCWAEPILDGAEEEPSSEGVEVAVLVNPITIEVAAEVIAIIANTADKVNKGRKLLQAARAAEVLAQEIQQQEEEGQGDAEASKPPAGTPAPAPEPPDNEEPPEEPDDDDIFKRPEGVPEDWERRPAKKGKGIVYEKPGSKGSTYVKIQKGNPNSSQPGQRVDNVRWVKDGKSLDRNGNVVPRNSEESHIPLEKFSFDKRLFK